MMRIIDIINTTDTNNETLSLRQLLDRPLWAGFSEEDIIELGDKGFFGLYYKPSRTIGYPERKSYGSIVKYIRWFINKKSIKKSELNYYLDLKDELIKFAKNNKFLLKNKPGYIRLATAIEVEIFPSCETGSVGLLKKQSEIDGRDLNDFGFTFLAPEDHISKKAIISETYSFYCKRIAADDLLVFFDQIEAFEKQMQFKASEKLDFLISAESDKTRDMGKKLVNNFQEFWKKGVQSNKEKADKKWQPLLDTALKIAKKKFGKCSAKSLEDQLIKGPPFRSDIKVGSLRKKIRQDPRFDSLLITKPQKRINSALA